MPEIDVITPLLESALQQTIQRLGFPNARGHFITIDNNNRVREHQVLAQTVFSQRKWTICTICSWYQDYGWRTNYSLFTIINETGEVVNEIALNKWEISKIGFIAVRDGAKPMPKVTFSLIENPSAKFEFESYSINDFQTIWNLFLEIDEKCDTVKEAELYSKYFTQKLLNEISSATIEEYKKELEEANNLAFKYKELLQRIEGMTIMRQST